MRPQRWKNWVATTIVAAGLIFGAAGAALGQAAAPAAPAAAPAVPAPEPVQPGAVVRRVIMKDSLSAEQFKVKLEAMKATGLFRDTLPGADPKKPVNVEISFLVSGNYLLVTGSREWVEANIATIRLMGFLFERPQAHLQLSLRVVQITGPANAEVIQMSETVRALVDTQRDEVVRAFSDLGDYLVERLKQRKGAERDVYEAVAAILPSLGDGTRPPTVPEILLLLMLDRSSPAPMTAPMEKEEDVDAEAALLLLPRTLSRLVRDPRITDAEANRLIAEDLQVWKKAVSSLRDWCAHYAGTLKEKKDGGSVAAFREALQQPNQGFPTWLARRLHRSIELTERLYPNLLRRHTEESLRELERRFTAALERAATIEKDLSQDPSVAPAPEGDDKETRKSKSGKEGESKPAPVSRVGRNLIALKSLAEELVPAPLALFDTVAMAAENSAPSAEQLIQMFKEYAGERKKLDVALNNERDQRGPVNYAKLQTLEASLNLWMRRVSEAMARALEQQFYNRYVNELRVLANKELGKTSNRDLLQQASIDTVPDVTRDLLLSDMGVNIFVTNSISLQFAPNTTNSVSAQVQASLPSKQGLLEKVQQASAAASALNALTSTYGIAGEGIVKALLAGGQAVPVQGGITLSAMPSIGFDASTVTLSLTANQTLQPNTDKVADRVTNHSINNATVTALSYEPMVLSTLASNISYYENTGGIPILRKAPGIGKMLKDIPLAPFKEGKRQKGVYQSSVIILEPVVIPTIEDLVRFHSGWRDGMPGLNTAESELDK